MLLVAVAVVVVGCLESIVYSVVSVYTATLSYSYNYAHAMFPPTAVFVHICTSPQKFNESVKAKQYHLRVENSFRVLKCNSAVMGHINPGFHSINSYLALPCTKVLIMTRILLHREIPCAQVALRTSLDRQNNSLTMFRRNLPLFSSSSGRSIPAAVMVFFDDQLFLILTKLNVITKHHHFVLVSEYGGNFFQRDTFCLWEDP